MCQTPLRCAGRSAVSDTWKKVSDTFRTAGFAGRQSWTKKIPAEPVALSSTSEPTDPGLRPSRPLRRLRPTCAPCPAGSRTVRREGSDPQEGAPRFLPLVALNDDDAV